MLGSKKSAPKPVVQLKSVVQPKRPLHLKKSETPLDISKILSSSASKRQSTTREETEMERIMKIDFEQEFASDFETSSIASESDVSETFSVDIDEVDVEVKPAVKRVRTTLPTVPATAIRKDNRPFSQFMKEEGLVEVVRNWKKYPHGSKVEIKAGGALWIADEKTHVIISKSTQDEMKNLKLWGQRMKIDDFGYVLIGSDIVKLHNKLAKSKKDRDFHDLLGWTGKKEDLIVLHLDDCPFNFNLDNLRWHSSAINKLLMKSKGKKHGKKFCCSMNINGHRESTWSVTTLAEARHSVDVLKINTVSELDRDIVFKYGLNYSYPSIEILMARSHLYKTVPSYQGNPFKSFGNVSLVDWKYADLGLKKAVEDSKFPFDPAVDVLVFYEGSSGNCVMFIIERGCFNAHFLDQEVTCRLGKGYVVITKQDLDIRLHRLVLGLENGEKKFGRHATDHFDGRRDNRLRVLRKGNNRNNQGDRDQKTSTSTSIHQGVSWSKSSKRWKVEIRFSNRFCQYKKYLGMFGVKGNKETGLTEGAAWREKVKLHVDRINELLKDIQDLTVFKRRVDEEVKKLK